MASIWLDVHCFGEMLLERMRRGRALEEGVLNVFLLAIAVTAPPLLGSGIIGDATALDLSDQDAHFRIDDDKVDLPIGATAVVLADSPVNAMVDVVGAI